MGRVGSPKIIHNMMNANNAKQIESKVLCHYRGKVGKYELKVGNFGERCILNG